MHVRVYGVLQIVREVNKCFIVHRGSKQSGWFLEVVEYAVGGHRGLLVILKGREGRGWKYFAAKLGKVVAFFESSLGKAANAVLSCH